MFSIDFAFHFCNANLSDARYGERNEIDEKEKNGKKNGFDDDEDDEETERKAHKRSIENRMEWS